MKFLSNQPAGTADRSLAHLSQVYAIGGLLLIGTTWRLWLPQMAFPQVPLFGWACAIPRSADVVLAGAIVLGLIGALFRRTRGCGWIAFAIASMSSMAVDQHRLQVWAWHLVLAGLLIASSPALSALRRLRWLTIGLYAWSAASKCDLTFLHGPGRMVLQGLLTAIGIDPHAVQEDIGTWAVIVMVAWEGLTSLFLAFPRTRRLGLLQSLVLHVGLLVALGPWGLNHGWSVLLWNVLFLFQNPLLFGTKETETATSEPPRANWLRTVVAYGALGAGVLLPALQPWGLWDVWPSWAVYSTRGGWCTLLVRTEEVSQLPSAAQPYVRPPQPLADWSVIDVDAWSREALSCPVYPQSRFRIAIAAALSQSVPVRVELRRSLDHWTDDVVLTSWILEGGQIPAELKRRYWLNLRARPIGDE